MDPCTHDVFLARVPPWILVDASKGVVKNRWYSSWNILSATGELRPRQWSPLERDVSVFYNYHRLLTGDFDTKRGRNSRRITLLYYPFGQSSRRSIFFLLIEWLRKNVYINWRNGLRNENIIGQYNAQYYEWLTDLPPMDCNGYYNGWLEFKFR